MKISAVPARPVWRILHLLFSPRLAGSERYCLDLAERQAELGHEVHVLGQRGSAMEQALRGSAVNFHALSWPLLRGWQARHLIAQLAPDLAHAHLSPACKALAGLGSDLATVATLHVGYKSHQHAGLDGLICVNHSQQQRLGDYTGRQRVIPNWLPAMPTSVDARGRWRAKLGLGEAQPLVGAVGRLHPSKGMDLLIEAFKAQAPAEAALVIVGEGPQRAELERLAAGDTRIRLLGFQSQVGEILQALDLFVSPSREESFGLALVEAMSAGLPLLSSATEGPREILAGREAVLVEPGSASDLGRGLAQALAKVQGQRLARQVHDMQAFEPQRGVAAINELYAQLLQDRRLAAAKLGALPIASHA
ncbi:glycosyltransferase [Pelomonas sp. SE-A7]|uniref:glycosyltransferase n=1 Tax=Pelomonas sp. SE-A7 TaxID=3054953 RepID=UPI00259CCE4E|nr:glycosyltransferase [Pelomonas sp. SE-A7]MDM4765173.1 glycosyltransferase [Pelomonas sp. SE-A7]